MPAENDPQATFLKLNSVSIPTGTKEARLFPVPSCPQEFAPNAKTFPVLLSTKVCKVPQLTSKGSSIRILTGDN